MRGERREGKGYPSNKNPCYGPTFVHRIEKNADQDDENNTTRIYEHDQFTRSVVAVCCLSLTVVVDMTFTHEGNKTYFDGLVNFEKMVSIGKTVQLFNSYYLNTL